MGRVFKNLKFKKNFAFTHSREALEAEAASNQVATLHNHSSPAAQEMDPETCPTHGLRYDLLLESDATSSKTPGF